MSQDQTATYAGADISTLGNNLYYVQNETFDAIATKWSILNTTLATMDPDNPASLLQAQFAMSNYESAVQASSQLCYAMSSTNKDVVGNIR